MDKKILYEGRVFYEGTVFAKVLVDYLKMFFGERDHATESLNGITGAARSMSVLAYGGDSCSRTSSL